ERFLIAAGHRITCHWREDARLFAAGVVVMPSSERVEGHTRQPLLGDAVRLQARTRDVARIDRRPDEDVSRPHLRRLHAIDPNDVKAVYRLDDRTQLPRSQTEHPTLELGDHRAAAVPSEVAALLARDRVHGLPLGDALEFRATLDLREERLGFGARHIPLTVGRLRSHHDLTERDRR